ncbi:murein biosynthesis integral membrane protein MurJ [Azospirillum picis]|uniref:Probable lipid II flippase MurJ n=1 Tax=Azospirillum picis TaxID=488438 RepID=A0ABU0MUI0_9PROT|nr:murein biosynthesis integral membrane protein MurJ [Azospirillum picis]MBP2303097.1 putative peptidoglycan lipid II flippase [Azospirillum picis]MDQ0536849.1 putative peptidoglycan lipid II flippase [Azospirillum picis]
MNFARAIATVGGLTLLSRLAGFARDILTAAVLGAGPVADAFFVALKLPNLFRRLFAEGAFGVAFVPLFAAELQTRGRAAAIRFAEEALALLLTMLLPFTVAAIVAMPWLMHGLAPGFVDDPAKFGLAVDMARLTFPYLALVSLVALLGGVLNALDRFGPFAAAPIAFNLTLVAALLIAPRLGLEPGRAMAAAVTLSGAVQVGWMAWACRRAGVTLRLRMPRMTEGMRRLFRLIGPGALGAGVMQINLFVNILLASLLPSGSVSFLYYADRLNQMPLGVIGIAIGTALLPVLARHAAAGDDRMVRHYLSRALEFSLLLGLPAAVALGVAGEPIVAVLFQRGAFGPAEAQATAMALAAYAVGIPAYVIVKSLNAAFFARHDTTTPVRVAVVVTVATAVLALALMPWLEHVGIALSTGLTAWLDVALLVVAMRRRGLFDLDERLKRRAPRIAVAAAGMGAALLLGCWLLAPWLAAPATAVRFAALALLVGGGAAAFGLLAVLLGGASVGDLKAMLKSSPSAGPRAEGGLG